MDKDKIISIHYVPMGNYEWGFRTFYYIENMPSHDVIQEYITKLKEKYWDNYDNNEGNIALNWYIVRTLWGICINDHSEDFNID